LYQGKSQKPAPRAFFLANFLSILLRLTSLLCFNGQRKRAKKSGKMPGFSLFFCFLFLAALYNKAGKSDKV